VFHLRSLNAYRFYDISACMQTLWVHFSDITRNELTTVVKVVRNGPVRTRVLLSNGRNDLVPSPVYVGDKVVLCPYPNEKWTSGRDATLRSLKRMKDEGRLPAMVIERLAQHGWKI
jgi:hypothetical protein